MKKFPHRFTNNRFKSQKVKKHLFYLSTNKAKKTINYCKQVL